MLGCINDVRQLEHDGTTGWGQDDWNGRKAKKSVRERVEGRDRNVWLQAN